MKRKRLALLLAAAMTVTSLDTSAMFVSGADFSSEVEEEVATQAEEGEDVAEEISADDTSADVEFSDETIDAEVPDEPEVEAEVTDEEASQDADVQVEEDTDEPDFSADVQEDVAADAGGGYDTPVNETALELDKDYTVDLKNTEESAWFKFTPSETGRYNFCSDAAEFVHPCVYFYDMRYSMAYQNAASNNKDNNFVLTSMYLEEGVTYYYQVQIDELEEGADSVPFTVRMEKMADVKNVKVDLSKMQKEFIAGLDYYTAQGVQLTVTYENGREPAVLTFGKDMYSNSVEDYKGNRFYYILTKDGEEDDYDYENLLTAGRYEVSFRYQDRDYVEHEIAKTTVTAKKPDASMFDALKLGENTVEANKYVAIHWYYFEAKEDGIYNISIDVEDAEDYEVYDRWKKIDQDGNLSDGSMEWDSSGTGYRMERGDKCLVGWYYEDDRVPFNIPVKVSKVPQVTSVTAITDDMQTEFTEYVEPVTADGLMVKVSYEDGTSQTVKHQRQDSYGRYLDTYLLDANGGDVDISHPKAGKYVFKVRFGGKDVTDIPITVVPVDSKVTAGISDGVSEVTNNGKVLLKYTASEDGRYQFDFNAPVNQIEIYKADGNYADNVSCEVRRAFADFEKGTTYYVYAQPDDLCKKLTVNVTLTTRPVSLAAKSLRKTAYIAGIDAFDSNDIETTVNYGNTSRTVKGTDSLEGYELEYRVENTETGDPSWAGEPLSAGTWTVTPYLASGSAVAVAESVATVTAKMFDENELKAFPTAEENKWTSVENTRGDRKIYTFTPKESGLYTYSWEDKAEDRQLEFYEADTTQYRYVYEEYGTHYLTFEAGKTYLVLIDTYEAMKFKIDRVDPGAKPETLKELSLTDGMKKNVEIDKSVDYLTCTFTPKENGTYRFRVSEYDGINTDSSIELRQGGKTIYSRSEKVTAELSAGKEYIYRVKIYNTEGELTTAPFTLEFNKIQAKEIKSMDLVLKNGKKASDLSVFDNFGDFYQLKVTYVDGKTWTTDFEAYFDGFYYVTDLYNNGIEIRVEHTSSFADATMKATVNLYLEGTANQDSKLIKKEVTCKAVGSLPAIEAGKDYRVPKSSTQYKFIPEEDGEYICTRSDRGGISYVSVFRTDTSYLYNAVESVNEGEEGYSMQLEKGKTYYINAGTYQSMGTDATFRIQKINKTINGLKVVTPPTKKTLLPNNKMYENELVSLSGLKAEVSYTDGTKETIAYGQPSQEGRYIRQSEVVWMANGKAKVYVALGRYTASFELKADSWDNVPEIKLGESKALDAQPEDSVTLKFVPKETGVYYIYTTNSSVSGYIRGTSSENKTDYIDGCNLKAGETYYFTVIAVSGKPVVTVRAACKDDKHSFGTWKTVKAATCVATGLRSHTCTNCGIEETEVIPVTGKHTMSNWKTVKAATCVATGLRSHTCTNCGIEETEVLPATGKHTMGSWKTTSEATAVKEGKRERTCKVCGKKETSKIAKLKARVTLNAGINKTIPLKVKQSYLAKATGLAKGDKVVSWTTSSAKIATVSRTGTVVGKGAGTATITVKLLSGLKASFKVKVQKTEVATTALKVVNKANGKTLRSATLKLKKSLTLVTTVTPTTSKQKVTYTSSNKKVATVSSRGVITAKKKGKTTITVKSGKKAVRIQITVK